jgi:hypothetical protein
VIDDERVGDDRVRGLRETSCDWPMPSRITLPPPNFTSSPWIVKSRSTSIQSSVSASARGRRSVGPNISA